MLDVITYFGPAYRVSNADEGAGLEPSSWRILLIAEEIFVGAPANRVQW
jgi:hypothetical protein